MKRFAWEAMRLLERPGWRLMSMVAVLFAVSYYGIAVVPALEKQAAAIRQHAKLESHAFRHPEADAVSSGKNATASLVSALPSYRTLPRWLAEMFAIARNLDVVLDMGDYRYTRNRDEPFGRYQIELPIYADYATVRSFTARLMNDMPFAVLDDISLTREGGDSEIVEAHLRLTLFLAEH